MRGIIETRTFEVWIKCTAFIITVIFWSHGLKGQSQAIEIKEICAEICNNTIDDDGDGLIDCDDPDCNATLTELSSLQSICEVLDGNNIKSEELKSANCAEWSCGRR